MIIIDKEFELFISEEKIIDQVSALADRINKDYEGKNPLFIGIMNGSFMFASDLMKHINIPSEITFIKVSSYEAMQSSGKIKELVGLQENIFNRNIIFLEDIVDTGTTMAYLTESFKELGPQSISICSLLFKPESLKVELELDYAGFEIPNAFVVGYGLDYDGQGRNLRDIYQLKS